MDSDRHTAIPPSGQASPPDPGPTRAWTRDPAAATTGQAAGSLGDYEILETIAHGGMGVVYKARQISLQRIVALKRIRAGKEVSPEEEQRFLSEAAAVARLNHPGIVPIFQVGRDAGELFYAMGLVEGPSLQRKLESDPLGVREAAACMAKVAGAVAYAHSQGVIHRDLKPSNILIDRDGEPKITDFGLAKQIHADSSLTATGQVLGTPSFMPPEQAAGSGKQVTPAVDVYAVGATLYCLLARRPPFAAANPAATLLQVLEHDPLPLRLLAPEAPRDLETICHKCLEKDPRRRYASAADLQADLERFLRDEPIRARPAAAGEVAWRWCRRNPRLAALAAALAVAVTAGALGIAYQFRRTLEEKHVSEHRLYAAHMSLSARDVEKDNLAPVLGRLRLYRPQAGEEDLRSFEWYYLWRQCHRDRQTVSVPVEGFVLSMCLSPGGKWLAVAELKRENSGIRMFDVTANQFDTTIPLDRDPRGPELASRLPDQMKRARLVRCWDRVKFLTFSPDGQWLAAYSDDISYDADRTGGSMGQRRIVIWDVGSSRQVTAMDVGEEVQEIALSRDRSTLALLFSLGKAETWDLSMVASGAPPTRIATLKNVHASRLALSPGGDVLAAPNTLGLLRLFDARTGELLREPRRPADGGVSNLRDKVDSVAFSTSGKLVAVHAVGSNAATVFDVDTGEAVLVVPPDPRPTWSNPRPNSICFSPDDSRLAFACGSSAVVWDLAAGREIARLRGHSAPVIGVAFAGSQEQLVSLAHWSALNPPKDGEVKQWDLRDFAGPPTSIAAQPQRLAIAPNGQWIAIPHGPQVSLVDAATNVELLAIRPPPVANAMQNHGNSCEWVAISNDGKRLAVTGSATIRTGENTGATIGQLWIYDLGAQDGKWSAGLAVKRDMRHWITGLNVLADGRVIASDHDKAEISDLAAQTSRIVLPDKRGPPSGDNNRLDVMASNRSGDVLVFQVGWSLQVANGKTGRIVSRTQYDPKRGQPDFLAAMDVSPDGRWLATAHLDHKIRIWDLRRPGRLLVQPAQVLAGHNGIVNALCFHPGGKTLLSGGVDGLVKVWDVVTGDERLTLEAHPSRVTGLSISADGTTLVTSGGQDGVKVWRAASEAEVRQRETATVAVE